MPALGHVRVEVHRLQGHRVAGADCLYLGYILIAPTGQVQQHRPILQRTTILHDPSQRMCRFKRRDDSLGAGQQFKGVENLGVGHCFVAGPTDIGQVGMLRPNARVVESGRNRLGFEDLTGLVLHQVRHGSMDHANHSPTHGRPSGRLDADQLGDPEAMAQFQQAQGQLRQGLGRLLASFEAYPQITSSQNFLALQSQLEGTENRIAVAIRDYNEAVRGYNTTIRTFPDTIGANLIHGAEPLVPYEAATEGAEVAPTIDMTDGN